MKQAIYAAQTAASMNALNLFQTFPDWGKTYAPSPVWRASTRKRVQFFPINKQTRSEWKRRAAAFNRDHKYTAKGKKRAVLGASAMAVYDHLAFYFMNGRTGQLDPSYETIAKATGLSRATVARSLKLLKELRLINWLRRCSVVIENGITRIVQLTNAYGLNPPSNWRGFKESQPPALQPDEWGAAPVMPDTATQAVMDGANGDTAALVRTAETDPTDKLAATLARLGKHFVATSEVSI